LSPKVSGRLLFLQVREGDRVQAGQVLARIDPAEVEAEVRSKQATLAQAESRLAEAELTQNPTNVGVTAEISRQRAALQTAQAQSRQASADVGAQLGGARSAVTEAAGRVAAVEADIASAEATIRAAQANLDNARTKLEREEALVKEGATARENVDNARTTVQVQEATLGEARQKREAAIAARASAVAQKRAAEQQVAIVNNKARADVAAANAGVTQARAGLSSARANTAQRPAYEQSLQALRAAVRAARADLRANEVRLRATSLRSPLTGVVTQRNLDPGSLVSPAQTVLTVQDARQVWLTVGVPEEVRRRVFSGQSAQVTFDGLPGQTFAGRVLRINPSADPQSRQFTLRVRLDNRTGEIRPGMFGRVVLVTERARQALSCPKKPSSGTAKPRTRP
jgi:multidrug resistance efflux pump